MQFKQIFAAAAIFGAAFAQVGEKSDGQPTVTAIGTPIPTPAVTTPAAYTCTASTVTVTVTTSTPD